MDTHAFEATGPATSVADIDILLAITADVLGLTDGAQVSARGGVIAITPLGVSALRSWLNLTWGDGWLELLNVGPGGEAATLAQRARTLAAEMVESAR